MLLYGENLSKQRPTDPRLAAVLANYLESQMKAEPIRPVTALERLAILINGWHPRDGYGAKG